MFRARKRGWRKANGNRDLVQRRLKELGAEGDHTQKEWRALCARYGNRCLICQGAVPLQKDHMVPVTKGGTHYIWNMAPLCGQCNRRKAARFYCSRPDRLLPAYSPL
jgi:5-methylcytosine-specific restriction endonuclease McrA